jgi:poly(hydroxyalkanoate) depolymerase family esterase
MLVRKLSDTLARLSALAEARKGFAAHASGGRLSELADFGTNPGALGAKTYIPDNLPEGAPLVVVLHGCTQTPEGYDAGSGWSHLADQDGFALLFPEQRRANNPNLCFNWFTPSDFRRDEGEALSIRQMIAALVEQHKVDPARIYVTGLSAGGAMASVLLATYPEVFAGGAIIAGLPYGIATNIPQAFDRMRGHGGPDEAALSALVSEASSHGGPWPTISVWHGSGDATVDPANAAAIVRQWRALHGVAVAPSREETVDGYPRRVWTDASGRDVIEEYSITGMGHGTPLASLGEAGVGQAGAYMLEAHISSTLHIARFWGLDQTIDAPVQAAKARRPVPALRSQQPKASNEDRNPRLTRMPSPPAATPPSPASGVTKVIEDALRSAGLMR